MRGGGRARGGRWRRWRVRAAEEDSERGQTKREGERRALQGGGREGGRREGEGEARWLREAAARQRAGSGGGRVAKGQTDGAGSLPGSGTAGACPCSLQWGGEGVYAGGREGRQRREGVGVGRAAAAEAGSDKGPQAQQRQPPGVLHMRAGEVLAGRPPPPGRALSPTRPAASAHSQPLPSPAPCRPPQARPPAA